MVNLQECNYGQKPLLYHNWIQHQSERNSGIVFLGSAGHSEVSLPSANWQTLQGQWESPKVSRWLSILQYFTYNLRCICLSCRVLRLPKHSLGIFFAGFQDAFQLCNYNLFDVYVYEQKQQVNKQTGGQTCDYRRESEDSKKLCTHCLEMKLFLYLVIGVFN